MRITLNETALRTAAAAHIDDHDLTVDPDARWLDLTESSELAGLLTDIDNDSSPTPLYGISAGPTANTTVTVIVSAAYDSDGVFDGLQVDGWIEWISGGDHQTVRTHSPGAHLPAWPLTSADTTVDGVVALTRTLVDRLNDKLTQAERAWSAALTQSVA